MQLLPVPLHWPWYVQNCSEKWHVEAMGKNFRLFYFSVVATILCIDVAILPGCLAPLSVGVMSPCSFGSSREFRSVLSLSIRVLSRKKNPDACEIVLYLNHVLWANTADKIHQKRFRTCLAMFVHRACQ